ncbi:unnamed protein product [Trichogramma brassicae]|uniref:diphthine methyl ester synthase n=1 Tax=Trichogramma brassicae TaxID=86971 RepID=A0A6H5HZH5_9HYME|nr:unnamed protein product [Trichogramma brassicae]
MLYLIGLGLGDEKDITVKGLEAVRKCKRVYLESYTSILTVGAKRLAEFYGKEVIELYREDVESEAFKILKDADKEDVALLVVGDPFGATTHSDLLLRAKEDNIEVKVIHNASIITGVGCCGLQLYTFGEIVSIPYWNENWEPDSFYDKILVNYKNNSHTLCLLDIKVKEPTPESMCRKKKEYMPPQFMSVKEACLQILKKLEKIGDSASPDDLTKETIVVGLARVGCETQKIVAGTLEELSIIDMGEPLHCMVIPGKNLHPLESDYLVPYATAETALKLKGN